MNKFFVKLLIFLLISQILLYILSFFYGVIMLTDNIAELGTNVSKHMTDMFTVKSNELNTIRKGFVFSMKGQLSALVLAFILLGLFSKSKNNSSVGAEKSKNETYGSNSIASDKEIMNLSKDSTTYILGKYKNKYIYQPNKSNMNRHVLVNAPTGSGKTTAFGVPNIKHVADLGQSFISTDTKGDTYNATAKYLKESGYKIYVINLIDKNKSNTINPFDNIATTTDAQNFVDSFLKSTGTSKGEDSFWDKAEALYMTSLVLYVCNHFEKEYRNIPNWINLYLEIGDDVAKRDGLFSNINDDNDKAKKMFKLYRVNSSTNVQSSVLLGISTRLQYFLDEDTEGLLSKSDFSYDELANGKVAIFVITQERDIISNIISSIIMTQIIDKLVEYANSLPTLKFNQPIHIIADEFGNIAKLKSFANTLTTVRAKNIIITAIIQELNQIFVKYKDDYKTILSSFDTKLLLGTTDIDTIEYFIKLGGKYTADITSNSESDNNSSQSTRIGEISVLNDTLIKNLDTDSKLIAFIRGHNPMIIQRLYWFKDKNMKIELQQSYWHDLKTNQRKTNYKTLNLDTESSMIESEYIPSEHSSGIEFEDDSTITNKEDYSNFKGFGNW
ncbi:type IV secretory system conjugative DNA transfer family protein [Mammaliicoccus sp. D-M17]|uniref:VirD4-like conjugal transfer protein, CD1115 family n=1 Tax=Mammaliicoccus sp. D-M17 TaxID=2898677 RepID=UPI001EFB2A02|nr:type IV secretory system conjugative DNA transfer family protein [Mammaliicoccus sp. D-M17]